MSFATPGLLWLLLAVPAALAVGAWAWRRRLAADAAWAARSLWDRLRPGFRQVRVRAALVLLGVAVFGVALALARPRWGAVESQVERRGVDVVYVLDSSLSMNARDVAPSRLAVAKTLVRRLTRDMPNNRVALVQAEGEGQVMAPLTLDGAVIDLLLDAIEPGSLPVPGTELASALEAARKLFDPAGHEHRAVVLLTDGEDHGAGLDKLLAELRTAGIAVHVIGVATPEGAPVPLPAGADRPGGGALRNLVGGLSGQPRDDLKRDENGDVVISRLDEPLLEGIASETGGTYLRAIGPALDLQPIERPIDEMEKNTFESETMSQLAERFQWPLALAAAALAALLAGGPFAHRRTAETPAAASHRSRRRAGARRLRRETT